MVCLGRLLPMRSAVKPSLEVTDDGRLVGFMLMSPLIWVSIKNRIIRVVESAAKIGTESEAIDLAEGVSTTKVDSSSFSSRLWLAQLIRYP